MSKSNRAGLAVLTTVAVAILALGGYQWTQYQRPALCGLCQRPLREKLRVIAEVGGKRRDVCCARCAITEALQEKKPLRLVEVRDYSTARPLKPEDAYYVDDSRAMACDHDETRMNEMKHSENLAFDRCSPGTFAFARQEDAEVFVRENGGVIRRLPQLLQGVPHD